MSLKLPVYLDYNATTPVDPAVMEVMLPYFTDKFGNPSSSTHVFGWAADEAVQHARAQVAGLLHAGPEEIIFTSGATEGCNLAIRGVYDLHASRGNHIITCTTEHSAVLDVCSHIEKTGGSVTRIPVDRNGLADPEAVEAAVTDRTILIAVMYANNETGVIQPVREISRIARRHGILFFTDAAQAAGKIPVDVNADGIDLMTLSAHKMYGPKGVGALYVRRRDPRARLRAQIFGGGQERGLRSGTLNVPGIAGLGKACSLASGRMQEEAQRLTMLRDRLEQALVQTEGVTVNGAAQSRLPHVSNVSFRHTDGRTLIRQLAGDIAVSAGSACASAAMRPSHVLKAMGRTDTEAYGSLRFSLGLFTNEEAIDHTINTIRKLLRDTTGAADHISEPKKHQL